LLNPYQNTTTGIDFLSEQIDRYDGDVAKALVGYNQGHYKGTVTKYALAVMERAEELRGATYAVLQR
jgi:soluble lytic murein transglycosylase-like protein